MDDSEFQTVAELHRAGRLAEAQAIYRKILEADPEDIDVIHLLGVLCKQLGRDNEAIRLLEQAVGLDPVPYVGGTTTCDALWMGVPVITLQGQTALARGGVSILSNVGLADLIAKTSEEYVGIGAALASDLTRLGNLRSTILERMLRSPLMDSERFAVDVENAYREMWRSWCDVPR